MVDKSIVVVDTTAGDQKRHRLLEPIRQYALDRLRESGEEDSTRNRHRDCFLAFAEEAAHHLQESDQKDWLKRLDAENDNFRAALQWSVDGEKRMRLSIALHLYWLRRGFIAEGLSVLEGDLLRKTRASGRVKVDALNACALLIFQTGDYVQADRYWTESLALARGNEWTDATARALNNLGMVAKVNGNLSLARTHFEAFLDLCKSADDPRRTASGLSNLATVVLDQGDSEYAKELFQESCQLFDSCGDRARHAMVVGNLAEIDLRLGNAASARSGYLASCRELGEVHCRERLDSSLLGLARAVLLQGDCVEAAWLLGRLDCVLKQTATTLMPTDKADYDQAFFDAETTLGADTVANIRTLGQDGVILPELADRDYIEDMIGY